ncbi:MAG: S9 family peptidase [Chitinophagia bacterium]|jgi:dipeptidyl aminopeptidase/acylaminoacyl peptidase|nr:S9 family peptidase [Chitinophagia bacterium]
MKQLFTIFSLFISFFSFSQKLALDHSVYDQWESIRETIWQPQGQFICYTINPQEGDAVLIVKNITSKSEIIIPRGAQPVFTEDGNYLIAKIKPTFNETRKAKIDKKKPDEMPKDSLVILSLATGKINKIPTVKSFQVPEFGNGLIAYLMDPKSDFNKEGAPLYFRDLNSGQERVFSNISQYLIHPKGEGVMMYQVRTKLKEAKIFLSSIADTNTITLNSHFYTATNFTWDEQGKQLAYLVERDSVDKALQKNYTLAYYNHELDSAHFVLNRNHDQIPKQYTIGGDRKITFSKSGAVISLGIQPILPIKDTSLPEFDRVSVDIWHYADPTLQTVQLKNLDATLKSTEALLYRPADNGVTYLGKIKDRDLLKTMEGDGRYTYALIDSNYVIASQWQGFSQRDLYVIDNNTGKNKLIQKNIKVSQLSPSYDGQSLVYYVEDQKKYKSYNAVSGVTKNILTDIPSALYDEENDVPDDPNAYGIAKWMQDNKHFLVYDRYDIWLGDAEGKSPSVKLTNGRQNKISYRFVETDNDRQYLNGDAVILLRTFNEVDKSEGLVSLSLGTRKLFTMNQLPMHLTTIVAAKKSNDLLVMQEDEKQSPNLYHYSFDTLKQNPIALTQINPQQSNYNWMSSQLVKWKSYTGKTAEGVLYLPENFDPKKKYPMIVYFYERNNQSLHNYLPPAPTPSRLNIPFFASRGYVVFVPDIWYTKGYPGQGAYDYILSGARAMVQKGFVDSTKIGLQGQSWGGYQIAYLITKTNLFAAAWAGAPVVNMTSAYGGIRWGSGLNRQFQYEKTQSRIGASLWERPDLYIKNSPLFDLPKVTTPLVIMSNDADDAVPWYQGIEMFTAMRRLDKKVWLLVYNNEAHNLVERKNRKDIQIREQQFFDSFLKGAPMPTWLNSGVPAMMKGRTLGLN